MVVPKLSTYEGSFFAQVDASKVKGEIGGDSKRGGDNKKFD